MKSIALVLGSNLNNSTERSMDDMLSYFLSREIIVELFVPDIPYFHSYLFNLIQFFGFSPAKFYTNPVATRAAYLFCMVHVTLRKYKFNKYIFSRDVNIYKPYKQINLSKFDHVIIHCTYLLPFIKSKMPPLVTLNADYYHQQKVSPNPNWWAFCIGLLLRYDGTPFVNSAELGSVYSALNYRVAGIIPDGPSYVSFNYRAKNNRDFLLIYSHTSMDKGFNCLDKESLLFLENLNKGKISLLGSDLVSDLSKKFNNYGSLPYLSYLSKFQEYKLFLYLSNSDGFESPPIDALLSGCVVISSKTPAAIHYSKFTNRILVLESSTKSDIEKAVYKAIDSYSDLSKSEYENLLESARQHSAWEGAKRYLEFINKKGFE